MTMTNIELARYNMIEQQIRPWDVMDDRVLDLLVQVPREAFVPDAYKALAFTDMPLPLGHGQCMMPPKLEARILQALAPQPHETILEIGTGSGYFTALLARSAAHVYSVDLYADLSEQAGRHLEEQNIHNVTLEVGDAAQGWSHHDRVDAIVITAALPVLPDPFRQDIKVGGRLLAIVGESPSMEVQLIRRTGERDWTTENLFETDMPCLTNARQPERFVL
ncbi:MAG: protein-L-isoaspartate O-methyltransferase [Gammaproteobacteria bacterium]